MSEYPEFVFISYDQDISAQTYDIAVSCEAGSLVGKPVKYVRHDLNTRAAPDVPELVRYRIWFDSNYNEIVDEDQDGEYVRHSQASKIIAADRAEKHRAQEAVLKLERELAQYEAQVPVAEVDSRNSQHIKWLRKFDFVEDGIKLYASPPPAADLKAENSDCFMINDGVSYIHPELGEGIFFTDDLLRPSLRENKKHKITADVRSLIIAAREATYGGSISVNSEEYSNLDKALEKFSDDVDWENQP